MKIKCCLKLRTFYILFFSPKLTQFGSRDGIYDDIDWGLCLILHRFTCIGLNIINCLCTQEKSAHKLHNNLVRRHGIYPRLKLKVSSIGYSESVEFYRKSIGNSIAMLFFSHCIVNVSDETSCSMHSGLLVPCTFIYFCLSKRYYFQDKLYRFIFTILYI